MKLKKIDYVFLVIIVLLVVACVLHVAICYGLMSQYYADGDVPFFPQPYPYPPEYYFYAYPPETAFIFAIPYALAIFVAAAIWLIVKRVQKKKSIRTCVAQSDD